MRPDDIDRILAAEDELVPSSGFAASVLEAVRREASAPPPIPFPWKRAWPGLVAAALALVVVPAALIGPFARAVASHPTAPISVSSIASLLRPAADAGCLWVLVALVVTLASIGFSKRISGSRA